MMPQRDHLARYHAAQLQTPAWASDRQKRLKTRVFDTFDQFLQLHARRGLEPGMALVDLGGGSGVFVECCRNMGLEAQAFDISDGIDLERDRLPLEDGSVDVVTAISVIEHLHSPANMLNEEIRVLKPHGTLILVCPNWHYSMKDFFDDPTHVHPYTPRSLKQIIGMYGFASATVVPWLVKKPAWLWHLPNSFFVARRLIPFRGDAPSWIPGFLKGRTASILALGIKPDKVQS